MPLIQPQGTAMAQAEAPQEIEFRVKDSGIGISSSQLSSLFLAFSQVNHASGQFGGTGLGQ
jgi:signal transduction histidine kinase